MCSGAQLSGTVVASEIFTIDNQDRDNNDARFYKRYAIRFDGAPFPQPVYLNWWAQRVHQGNLSITRGKHKRELTREKENLDRVFAALDDAILSGTPVPFRIDPDLAIIPAMDTERVA